MAHGFHFYEGAPALKRFLYYHAEKFLSKYTDVLITINREDYDCLFYTSLDVGPGDEVITSAYTYTASASVICHVGARPVLVDIQSERPEMDYEKLENAITDRTKAIIPVDIAGIPCDYERIYEVVEKMRSRFRPSGPIQKALGRVAILADTAHSFGCLLYTSRCV